ncbi:anaerobic ribonucleoside-triphosphate reductase [Vibrio phage 3.058.O._10N.286.46.B8]|nr:anaerobic ribonucleoside-triphosphate reductase [Vibrio phage 2.058.O._10N.286.46.B8]AUS03193.1 anaerobic ribonucleoside-triphosphate reductase [Vibrio phage 3.058.O._10N.286.46.B8]
MAEIEKIASAIVYGTADKALLNSNANKASERVPVMKNLVAGEVAKIMANKYLPPNVITAHRDGVIHFHDMDESPFYPMFNCCLVDLKGMLANGFMMGNADIETPKSISTACAITAQIIAQVACHQYGGVSLNRLDEVLAPYVDKSYKKWLAKGKQWMDNDKAVVFATDQTREEVQNACQALEYEVNTLFTSQGQTPFVTFGFGLGTTWQAREIQKGILNTRIRGLGKEGRTAIFPKLVFMMDDDVNVKRGDPNYDIKKLAIKCASKRNYPDILNMPRLRETGNGSTPMGCRSFLHKWHDADGNEVWDGRNNLGVVSINLPRVGIISQTEDEFWANLDAAANVARKGLEARIDRLRGVKAKSAPILYQEGALGFRLDPEDDIMQVFENGRASISLGYIGINEMCNAFMGTDSHIFENQDKQKFAQRVVAKLKEYTVKWREESGWAYGLYSTPSESLCDRFCRIDAEAFGIIEGVTDRDYYTNSFHLDVEKRVSPMDKIDFEAPYHYHANSGHITYVEVPNIGSKQQELLETYIETVWDYASERVSYFGTNGVIDYCHECNSECDAQATDRGYECPHCGNHNSKTLEVTKRVCGYLGNPSSRPFIRGKQREVMGRVKHIT